MGLQDGTARIVYKMETRGGDLNYYQHVLRVPLELVPKLEHASNFSRVEFKAKTEQIWRKNFDWLD